MAKAKAFHGGNEEAARIMLADPERYAGRRSSECGWWMERHGNSRKEPRPVVVKSTTRFANPWARRCYGPEERRGGDGLPRRHPALPEDGRMLFGLMESLKAQGKGEQAEWVRKGVRGGGAKADIQLSPAEM